MGPHLSSLGLNQLRSLRLTMVAVKTIRSPFLNSVNIIAALILVRVVKIFDKTELFIAYKTDQLNLH